MSLEKDIIAFWDQYPCGAWHGDAYLDGSREYFMSISDFRDRTIGPAIQDFVRFETWRDKRVLEIGCGIGSDAMKFMQQGATYVGIDISKEAIQRARHRAAIFDLVGRFEVRDASRAENYRDLGTFDLVYCNGVLHHWPDMPAFVDNVWHCLSPNAVFAFTVYAANSWDHVMSQHGLAQFEAAAGCPWVRTLSQDEIQELMGQKFEITDLTRKGCFMYNVESYKNKQLILEPWFDCMPDAMRDAVDRHYGKYYYVKARKVTS
jgi:SAM-dependent methyltransferase